MYYHNGSSVLPSTTIRLVNIRIVTYILNCVKGVLGFWPTALTILGHHQNFGLCLDGYHLACQCFFVYSSSFLLPMLANLWASKRSTNFLVSQLFGRARLC